MDALKIKTLEEDNLFLLGQVQLLEARNRQLELRIAELSVSVIFYLCWRVIPAAGLFLPVQPETPSWAGCRETSFYLQHVDIYRLSAPYSPRAKLCLTLVVTVIALHSKLTDKQIRDLMDSLTNLDQPAFLSGVELDL